MTYSKVEISDVLLEATSEAWKNIAGEDEFSSEYLVLFDWLKSHRNYSVDTEGSLAYALVDQHGDVCAFFEVVTSKNNGGLTKLLKVFVTPQFWNVAAHQDEVIRIYVGCINGFLSLSRDNLCRTIKIYGRTDAMLTLLSSLYVSMQKELELGNSAGISIRLEGRWLVFSLN